MVLRGIFGWILAALLSVVAGAIAAEPPVDVIKMESTALLESRLNKAVNPEAVAKDLRLSWPVAKPTKTAAEIEAELARRLQARAGGSGPAEIDEAELQRRAVAKVPLAGPGDQVVLSLATGGELRGELQRYAEGMVKVGGRTMRSSALAPTVYSGAHSAHIVFFCLFL